jgi:stearoyl-CoA desaturase (Delta-9 desaturase)
MVATERLPLDWGNVLLLAFVHLVALGGMAFYLPSRGLPLPILVSAACLTVLTTFSISAGYHRLFSHRAFEAHPIVRFLLLAFGAGAFQNSALTWAADHRRHHAFVDSDRDPYNVRRGFWYAHIGWVLHEADPRSKPAPVVDLERDPLVVWQHRHYPWVGGATGIGVPVLLGLACGDAWGGFIVAGAVRLVLVYHATFAINSFAHSFGRQPYSRQNSSRDSTLTALFTMGEGYHNFHHAFPADYRNGAYAHQFDPTKWAVWALAACGLTRNLRRTPQPEIVSARLRTDEQRLMPAAIQPSARERLEQLRGAIDGAASRWRDRVARYEAARSEVSHHRRGVLRDMRADIRRAARELQAAYERWNHVVRSLRDTAASARA